MQDKSRILVLPRNPHWAHKRRTFPSIESATQRLECAVRGWTVDSRGLVFDTKGVLVYTISLSVHLPLTGAGERI